MNTNPFDLDTVLLHLSSESENNTWTIRNAVEGVQIFGGIGSGKTSGSARTLALKYLQAGFGGLILMVKAERDEWVHYCKLTNRLNDLVILEPDGKHAFNFLEYESRFTNKGASITENLVHVLNTVLDTNNQRDSGKVNDEFWSDARNALISNTIDLCKLAYDEVTIQRMYDIIQYAPKEGMLQNEVQNNPYDQAFSRAKQKADALLDQFKQETDLKAFRSYVDDGSYKQRVEERFPTVRLFNLIEEFFNQTFINLNEKTRSIVEFSFSNFLYRLLREPVYSLFCNRPTTVVPEDCEKGKIILIDLPVKIYDKVGRDAQLIFKICWQRALERRNTAKSPRTCFLWSDEAQHMIHQNDAEFQATARSSRVATVYVTQNMSQYYANMGGQHSTPRVTSFLGTLGTKLFHSNADFETNKYASELIGDEYYDKVSTTKAMGESGMTISEATSEELKRVIRPEAFVRLLNGGPQNDLIVEGILHRQGKPFSSGRNAIKMKFRQDYMPH